MFDNRREKDLTVNQLSKVATAAALAAALWSSSASAALIFNGDYGPGANSYIGAYNATNADSGFFDNATADPRLTNPISGSFTNTFVFDFSPGGSASINANFNPTSSISGFTVALYSVSAGSSCTANTFSTAGTCTSFSLGSLITTGTPGFASSNIGFTPLLTGRYAFVVTGTVTSTPALYSGQLTTSPIPEPASLALVGAALVGLALTARQRRAA